MLRSVRSGGVVALALLIGACSDDASEPTPQVTTTVEVTTTTGVPTTVRTIAKPSDLIGRTPPDKVAGWDHRSGAVLAEDYVVSTWTTDREYVVLLERSTGRLPDGSPTSVVVEVASIDLPEAADSYDALPGDCRDSSDQVLDDVVALANGPDPYYNPATVGWRIDLGGGTLTRIDQIKGMTCWTGNPD